MVIYAMLSGASIGKLFMGGMVPGVLLAILLMIYVAFISHKRNYPAGVVMSKREFLRATLQALPALFTVVILLGGNLFRYLYSYRGWCCCFCIRTDHFCTDLQNTGMEKALGYHKEIRCQHSYTGSPLRNFHAVLLYYLSGAGSESCCKAWLWESQITSTFFLFIVNIVFLLLGCVLDVSTIQLVFVPMVLPLVQAMGIDLVHFGVVICSNMMIGLSTPPFGMLLFIVSGTWKNEDQGCYT